MRGTRSVFFVSLPKTFHISLKMSYHPSIQGKFAQTRLAKAVASALARCDTAVSTGAAPALTIGQEYPRGRSMIYIIPPIAGELGFHKISNRSDRKGGFSQIVVHGGSG